MKPLSSKLDLIVDTDSRIDRTHGGRYTINTRISGTLAPSIQEYGDCVMW